MKKILLLTLSVLTCGVAVALPVGNPSEASLYRNGLWWNNNCCEPCDPCFTWLDSFSLRLGFYGDYVFNRHMQVENSGVAHRGIDDTELFTNAGIVVLNFCDWIEAFATFGATNILMETNGDSFATTASNSLIRLGFQPKFSWSVGGRATVWSCDDFSVGVEGQYFQTNPNIDYLINFNGGTFYYPTSNNAAEYSEWQVGLGASYRWQTGCPGVAMIPYVAVQWAQSKLDTHGHALANGGTTYVLHKTESANLWGYTVGLTTTVNDAVGASVEARFGDEKAVYTTMQIRF